TYYLPGRNCHHIVTPIGDGTQWVVRFPVAGIWDLSIIDAIGRRVGAHSTTGASVAIDLGANATGMYVLQAVDGTGKMHIAKVMRP
ncbi:MAG: T9SS type A sorting domain-containing protein, partial [Flavobacteriales bacterium]